MSFTGFGNSNHSTFGGGGGSTFGNTSSGFGATTTTSGGLFGGGSNTATSGTFGSGAGFGSTNTTGGGIFGGGASTTSGFGGGATGFGANNTASTTFGAGNTGGGGLFGANKPATTAFGGTNSGSLFGGGATNTNNGFGANNNTSTSGFGGAATTGSGFGASNTTSGGFGGFGANTAQTNNGTAAVPFQAFQEKDGATNQTSHFQSITFQQPYIGKSFEELRVEDYLQGRRQGTTNGQAAGFGTSSGFGGSLFGGNNNNNNTTQSTGGSLFGGNTSTANNTSTGFGGFGANNQQQTASTGFGANNTSGGLFGAQTKGTGGLFGSTPAANTGGFGNTNNNTGGGLFGTNNNTTANTGFGANNNASTGGGLFGSNNAATAAKPAFGGFGQPAANTGGFGATSANAGGGLFGSSTTNNTSTGGGLFGNNNNQQQQTSNPFGGSTNTGGGLFGANNNSSAKPATGGLFGSTPAATNTGGLFGSNNSNNQQQQQQTGGLFGAQPANNAGGGLFGNNSQNKPATGGLFGSTPANNNTGGGLFGSSTNTNNNTGGLFGSTNNNNTGGGSLFGNNNANKPAGSLFGGSTTNNNTGASLFGGGLGSNNNQQATGGGSLFGSTNQQGNNNNSLFGSMNQSTNQNQQNQLHASLTLSPYGNDQLFSSLGQSSAPVGPLATPLTGARPTPAKTPSLLSSSRLNSPVYTPRAGALGRTGGYGFSYSTYGTPGSAYSVSLTPQASSLLKPTGSLGSALTTRLAKSMSMNNLRGDTPSREGESLLRPTPGSAASRYLNSGSMRKLTIDRNLRTDLFSPPASSNLQRIESAGDQQSPGLAKKVSFDNSAAAGARQTEAAPNAGNALVRTESDDDESPRMTRPLTKANGPPEMEQVNCPKPLNDIPEDAEPQRPSSAPGTKKPVEKTPFKEIRVGEYWTEPRVKDLKNMSRTQLSKLKMFTVGREGVGKIEFRNNGKGIDLTNVDLDKLFDPRDLDSKDLADPTAIVCLRIRSATVYPKESEKPPRGQALNVPSRIYLENSWPRSHGGKKAVLAKSGPAYEKHVKRFHNVENTKFVNYEADTGIWVFDVDHFTTYELDDDDEETEVMDGIQQESSELSDAPATLSLEQHDDTLQSIESLNNGDVDDTFEFKLNRSKSSLQSSHIPGEFGEQPSNRVSYDYDDASLNADVNELQETSGALGEPDEEDLFAAQGGAVQAPSPGAYERYGSSMALDRVGADDIAEHAQADTGSEPETQLPGAYGAEGPKMLRSILKPTAPVGHSFTSPQKLANDTWEEQLQRTMSPRKRDRQALKSVQQDLLRGDKDDLVESPFKRSMLGQSALGQSYLAQKSAKKVGFGGVLGDKQDFGKSQAFRTSMDLMNSLWAEEKTGARSSVGAKGFENPYPKKSRFSAADELDENHLAFHENVKPSFANNGTLVHSTLGSARNAGFPLEPALRPIVGEHREIRFARFVTDADLNTEALSVQKDVTVTDVVDGFPAARPDSIRVDFVQLAQKSSGAESIVWRLSALLFESIKSASNHLVAGMSDEQISKFEPRLRKDAVQEFWSGVVESSCAESIAATSSIEEKALYMLTRGDHVAAAEALAKAKNFRLATLIAQLPGTTKGRKLIGKQIEAWKARNDWSEMSDAVRALYSILAGSVCTVPGQNGAKEDRTAEFRISERFDLNWMQSFALRLFFGGHEALDLVVKAYAQNLEDGLETTLPTPFWTTHGTSEEAIAGREDTLLGLLRLYSTTRAYPADLEALFDPYTVSGSPFNSRLAWQLATILSAKGWTDYIEHATLDQITRDFAAELERANKFVTAVWVLLHLTESNDREVMIRSVLMRNGGRIPEPSTSDDMAETNVFDQLATENQIPESLLYEAKALHAQAELKSPGLQARYLLNAGLFDEAHNVLISVIGPASVIGEDYDELVDVLARFPEHGNGVQSWESGGAVYNDFAVLVTMNLGRKQGREGKQTMQRLRSGLEAMENGERKLTLEMRVSLIEMSRILAEEARNVGIGNVAASGGLQQGDEHEGGLFDRYQAAMGIVV